MSVGALSHFGFAEESAAAPGTLVPITKFFDPTSADIDDKFPRDAVATMREDRSQVRSVSKITEVNLPLESPLYYNALPNFLKFAMGKCTTTAAGVGGFKHVFEGTKILPSFSAEVGYDTAGAKQASGCKIGKFGIKAAAGEHATCSMDGLGIASFQNPAAIVAGLPADDNIAVFSHATVTFDGIANTDVISMDFGIDNDLKAISTLNGTFFVQRIAEGIRKITAEMEMDFRNQDMYNLSRNSTKTSVVLNFISPVMAGGAGFPFSFKIELPNVKFSSVGAPVTADGIISQKVTAIPLFDGVAGFDTKITVVNTDVSYPNVV